MDEAKVAQAEADAKATAEEAARVAAEAAAAEAAAAAAEAAAAEAAAAEAAAAEAAAAEAAAVKAAAAEAAAAEAAAAKGESTAEGEAANSALPKRRRRESVVRMTSEKQEAIANEEFLKANALKQELAAAAEAEAAHAAANEQTASQDDSAEREALIAQLQADKRAAVEAEDFEKAEEIKLEIKKLEAGGALPKVSVAVTVAMDCGFGSAPPCSRAAHTGTLRAHATFAPRSRPAPTPGGSTYGGPRAGEAVRGREGRGSRSGGLRASRGVENRTGESQEPGVTVLALGKEGTVDTKFSRCERWRRGPACPRAPGANLASPGPALTLLGVRHCPGSLRVAHASV